MASKMTFISLIKTYPVFFIFFLALMCIFTFQNLFSANLNSIVNDVAADIVVVYIAQAMQALTYAIVVPAMVYLVMK